MKSATLSFLMYLGIVFLCSGAVLSQPQQPTTSTADVYVCLPCGNDCDKQTYAEPGHCAHCQMELVKKATVTFQNIQPDEICNYIKAHPDVVLLDVRTKEEFKGQRDPDYGSLKNAINIPIQELKDRLSEISSLKNREIIVYCSHSHRSPQASYVLTQNGFSNVSNMSGGMSKMADTNCKVTGKR